MVQTAQCSNCGEPFRTNGPGPADGRRFCRRKACRLAGARRRRAKTNGLDPDFEEGPLVKIVPCASCGTLKRWRSGPGPADGLRFCEQKSCRAAYQRNQRAKINGTTDPEGDLMAKTAQCSNCGAPMHTTGPAPTDGKRFCQQNACHAAYLRRRRAKINGTDLEGGPVPRTVQCANCLAPVRTTGPAPADGRRFCNRNACHAAYLRRRRAKINGKDPSKMEDRPCTFCGDPLPSRSWRVTDIEAGRWCERNRCRRDKHVVLARLAEDGVPEGVAPLMALDAWEQALIDNFGEAKETVCAECDRTDARADYVHPDPETFLACKGTGYFFHNDLLPQMRELGWTKKAPA